MPSGDEATWFIAVLCDYNHIKCYLFSQWYQDTFLQPGCSLYLYAVHGDGCTYCVRREDCYTVCGLQPAILLYCLLSGIISEIHLLNSMWMWLCGHCCFDICQMTSQKLPLFMKDRVFPPKERNSRLQRGFTQAPRNSTRLWCYWAQKDYFP